MLNLCAFYRLICTPNGKGPTSDPALRRKTSVSLPTSSWPPIRPSLVSRRVATRAHLRQAWTKEPRGASSSESKQTQDEGWSFLPSFPRSLLVSWWGYHFGILSFALQPKYNLQHGIHRQHSSLEFYQEILLMLRSVHSHITQQTPTNFLSSTPNIAPIQLQH